MNRKWIRIFCKLTLLVFLSSCGTAQIGFEQEKALVDAENKMPGIVLDPIDTTPSQSPTKQVTPVVYESINTNDPGLVFFINQDPQNHSSMELAYLPLECFTGNCPDVSLMSGLPFAALYVQDGVVMKTSPERAWFAMVVGQADSKISRLFLQNLTDGEWQEEFSFPMPVREISWSGDETKLALLSSWMAENCSFYSIQLYDVSSRQSLSVFEQTEKLPPVTNRIILAGWSDKKLNFFRNYVDNKSELLIYSLEDQSIETALELDGMVLATLASPDGEKLLYSIKNGERSELELLDLEDLSSETLIGFYDKSIGSLSWSEDGQKIVFSIIQENYLPDLSEIFLYSISDRQFQQMISLPESRIVDVLFDPSGTRIVFDVTNLQGNRQIAAISIQEGKIIKLKNSSQENWLMPAFR